MDNMIKVLIADDDGLIRDSLRLLIDLESDMTTVGTARNGQEAFDLCRELRPDIVLMDIRMPEVDGVQGTRLIKQAFPEILVLILTTFKDDDFIKEAVKNGATGYILKSQPAELIISSLRTAAKGLLVFDKSAMEVLAQKTPDTKIQVSFEELNERELEIARLVSEGLSNKEIAQELFLSEGTVRNYITIILEKLQLRDRTQLAIAFLGSKK